MSEYKKIESGKVELQCTLEGDAYQAAQKKAFHKIASKLEIKGFRKGQAPENMIKKYINHQEVLIEAAESLAQDALDNALKEHDVTLIDRPTLKLDEINDEKCVMTFSCPTLPDVTLGDYSQIKYECEDIKIDEKDVDDQIANILDRKADLELKEDGAVEDGDTTVIDYEGFLNGVPFDGGKAENYDLVIGSHSFIPGFEEQLIGMKAEETKDINVTFPADYQAENLKGKETTFKVTVHEIKKKVLPELNDEFVKELKYENVNTVEELKEYTKKNLENQKKYAAENKAQSALMDKIVEIVDATIPEVMIKSETENMVQNYESNLMQQGVSLKQYLQIMGQTVDQFKESIKEEANKRVKINLGLVQIAKEKKIEVNDEDAENEYKKMADMYQMSVEDVKKYIPVENVKEDLLMQKTIDSFK